MTEQFTAKLPPDKPEFAPSHCGRAGDVAESVPIAGAREQVPDDEGGDGANGERSDDEGHCSGGTRHSKQQRLVEFSDSLMATDL